MDIELEAPSSGTFSFPSDRGFVDPIQLPPNSNRARETAKPKSDPEPDKKIEKVAVNPVTQRRKPLGRRFMETFFNGATAKGVIQYVMVDVVVPATKDLISDMVTQGIERALFGDSRSSSRRNGWRPGGGGAFTNYGAMSKSGGSKFTRTEDPARTAPRSRSAHEIDEIVLRTRQEAGMVYERMLDTIRRYGTVSINDLYDMVGLSGSYTDDKYGWTNLHPDNSGISRVRDGYVLDLPTPEPLN